MTIKEIQITSDNYELLQKNSGTIYNSKEWLNIYEDNLHIYGIYNQENKLIGAFNIYVQKKGFIKYYRNPFHSPSINLFIETKAKNKSKKNTEIKKIISLISDFIDKFPYNILSLSFPPEFVDFQPFFWKNYKIIPNYTYIINLEKDIKEIEADFSPERRNDIKKALKDNIVCKKTTDFSTVKKLVLKTFTRKQKAISEIFLDKILFEFANKSNSFAFVSYQNELPIATAFCIYDNFKTYYILGGYDNNNKHQGAGALAVLESIKYSKEKNIKNFDFEGSMLPEVEKYFRGFGGDLTPYYSVNKANFLIEIVLKFIKRASF